jgi:CRISPR-associated protein (TIGR02584 family)
MDAIQNIVSYVPEGLPGTISDDMAMEILTALANERVSQLLTPTEQEVLATAAGEEEFNNALLTKLTDKRKQHIATYIEKYMHLGLVHRIRQEGNEIFYEVAPDVRPLAAVEAQRHEE